MTFPGIHLAWFGSLKFLTYTVSWSLNNLGRAPFFLSNCFFMHDFLDVLLPLLICSWRSESGVFICLPMKFSAGDFWSGLAGHGVYLYVSRNFCTNSSVTPSPFNFYIVLLNVSTNLSAWPLLWGWPGGILTWRIEFVWQYLSNSADVNCVPLSETNVSGNPYLANILLNSQMVAVDVIVFIYITSGHLE